MRLADLDSTLHKPLGVGRGGYDDGNEGEERSERGGETEQHDERGRGRSAGNGGMRRKGLAGGRLLFRRGEDWKPKGDHDVNVGCSEIVFGAHELLLKRCIGFDSRTQGSTSTVIMALYNSLALPGVQCRTSRMMIMRARRTLSETETERCRVSKRG